MNDPQSIAQRYIDTWNATDPNQRRALIVQVFDANADYTDPMASVRGHDAIDQFIAAAQAQFVGLQFSLAGPVDSHHDQLRFTWHLGSAGVEEPLVVGFDVALIENEKLRSVYGFLDKVPALT